MNNFDELKKSISELLDSTEDKTTVEKIAVINKQVDDCASEYNKLADENKSILKDYKDLFKTTAFKVNENTKVDDGKSTEFNVESFITNYIKNNPNNK